MIEVDFGSHTTKASAQYPPLLCRWHEAPWLFPNKLNRFNGYPDSYQVVVRTLKVSRWPPRGGLDSEFLSPRTPAHDRQDLALCGLYARQFGPRLLIGNSQLTCTCVYACTHTCIYMHTHIHIYTCEVVNTYIHNHSPSGYPPPEDAPRCRCQLYPLRPKKSQTVKKA